MRQRIAFRDIDTLDTKRPGVYEVHTRSGAAAVGIAADLKKRLRQHRASRDSALKLKSEGDRKNPNDVLSKQSILAKHLYYDSEIAPAFDLTTELGRQRFLQTECVVHYEYTATRDAAREFEKRREASGRFRYVGRVRARP